MKKGIYCLSIGVLLFSCANPLVFQEKDVEIIKSIANEEALTINETTIVDNKIINTKVGYYIEGTSFKAYSCVLNKEAYFYNANPNSKIVEQYALNDKYLISIDGNNYDYECDSTSILNFKGFDAIFDKTINEKRYTGEIAVSSCYEIVRDSYYDLGYLVDYNSFIGEFNVGYSFSYNEELLSLELDLTNVLKKFFPLIENAKKKYEFHVGVDNQYFVEFPSSTPGGGDDKPSLETDEGLKKVSSEYIKNVYSKLQYVSNDLTFIYRCPKSGKLTYSYETSNTAILDNTGKFNAPSSDVEMELIVSLKLDDIEFEKQKFKFIAHAPATRKGILGSKENPIYQGRKKIDKVDIYFIEMHKQYGDSIYIKAGDFDMLIDAGTTQDGYFVSRMLQENMVDSKLDFLVATHAHSDHIGGMSSVLDNVKSVTYSLDYGYDRADYNTSSVVRSKMKEKSEKYSAVSDALKQNNGIIWISDDFYITILDTKQYISPGVDINGGDDNEASVTLLLTYKNHSYYFSGDLDTSGESNLVNSNQLKKVSLMKATHHGTSNGNSNKLLKVLKPEVVAISTALITRGSSSQDSKSQVHPSKDALSRFYNINAKVYCNFTMGTIHVTSTGNGSLSVEGLGLTSPYYFNGKAVSGEENKEFKDTMWARNFR